MIRPRIGLALGSGVARGWAHIGVLRALERLGVVPDVVCGTSIGALVGGLYTAGKLEELEQWALQLSGSRVVRLLDVNLSGGGLISGRRLARALEESAGDVRIEDLPKPFVAVCTELTTGHEIWLREGSLVDAVRASYALPGIFSPIMVDGFWLVDGALVNPVPTSVCRALGSRLVIAVNLNADIFGRIQRMAPLLTEENQVIEEDTEKGPLAFLRSTKRSRGVLSFLLGRSDGPNVFEVMVTSLNILQDRVTRARLAGDPPDVVVEPRVAHIGLIDFERAEEAIAAGEAAAERAMSDIENASTALGI